MSYPPPGDQSFPPPTGAFPPAVPPPGDSAFPPPAPLPGESQFPPPTGAFPAPAPLPGEAPFGQPPKKKSKAGVIVLAVVLPLVLLLLICGGVGGFYGYGVYQEEQRSKAMNTLVRTIGTPVGYSTMRRDASDQVLTATFTMYCTAKTCATDNPVKHAYTWLVATGFTTAGSEEDVMLCFRKSCTLHATRTTDAGKVELSAQLRSEMDGRKFRIHVTGSLPS